MKTLVLATLLAAVAAPSAHAASFTFIETFGLGFHAGQAQAVTATGSFDGDLAGTLITNLRNISVFANGIAFTGNGALVAAGMDDARGTWVPGIATASLDGRANNFFFADRPVGDPNDLPTNYDYNNSASTVANVATRVGASGPLGQFGYSTALTPGSGVTITRVDAPDGAVPEPATWALMLLGFGVVGYAMRRRPTPRRSSAI
ncbi:PEPxxWA-CTERM sorting domain-containing protein [uncultured Sphingomonas sp.]|uniref:PEPxxWA-CTERM sorting domain-containing protein n=1 Tax=uncultured Sphingomonas sp. TaxID=158754 RepID=UPI0025FA6DB8|nr:PEPxxWA-CTERM sorting domain-containing protein [uncultured Sphingomonas sp.]